MNDESRKRLTGYLGENYEFAVKCGMDREFNIWPDLGALVERIVEKGEWDEFILYLRKKALWPVNSWLSYPEEVAKNIEWLLNPTRFCEIVDRWLKRKEKP